MHGGLANHGSFIMCLFKQSFAVVYNLSVRRCTYDSLVVVENSGCECCYVVCVCFTDKLCCLT